MHFLADSNAENAALSHRLAGRPGPLNPTQLPHRPFFTTTTQPTTPDFLPTESATGIVNIHSRKYLSLSITRNLRS